jgi:hypothetical protein
LSRFGELMDDETGSFGSSLRNVAEENCKTSNRFW